MNWRLSAGFSALRPISFPTYFLPNTVIPFEAGHADSGVRSGIAIGLVTGWFLSLRAG
jgi:hypothetical protein